MVSFEELNQSTEVTEKMIKLLCKQNIQSSGLDELIITGVSGLDRSLDEKVLDKLICACTDLKTFVLNNVDDEIPHECIQSLEDLAEQVLKVSNELENLDLEELGSKGGQDEGKAVLEAIKALKPGKLLILNLSCNSSWWLPEGNF